MNYVIEIVNLVGSTIKEGPKPDGHFVQFYDPDAFEGRGDLVLTASYERALRFGSHRQAWEFYTQTSKTRPVREDGRPNRPLTAFSVQVRPIREDGELSSVLKRLNPEDCS